MSSKVIKVCGLALWVILTIFLVALFRHSNVALPYNIHEFSNIRNMHNISLSALTSLTSLSSSSSHKSPSQATRDRMAVSERTWKASVDVRHHELAKHDVLQKITFPPETQDFDDDWEYTIWDFLPATYTCPYDMQRIGKLGIGGKWICGMSVYESLPPTPPPDSPISNFKLPSHAMEPVEGEIIVYSFGMDASTFEAEILTRIPAAHVFGFDPVAGGFGPQFPTRFSSRAHFAMIGLGPKNEPNKRPPMYSLAGIMSQHKHNYVDILKIDAEGREFEALDAFMNEWEGRNYLPVGQILIQLHVGSDNTSFQQAVEWWERLEGFGMRPAWLEVNLLDVLRGNGGPRCVEYVLVNAKDPKSLILGKGI